MIKILIFLVVFSTVIFGDSMDVVLEYNFADAYTFGNGIKLEKDSIDLSLNFDFYSPPKGKILNGWGIAQSKVDVKGYEKNSISMTPYYLSSKIYLLGNKKFKMYIKGHAGGYYTGSILGKTEISNPGKIEISNGWYYGAGTGLEFNKFLAQFFYKVYNGESNINGTKTKFDYDTFNFSLGYAIDVN